MLQRKITQRLLEWKAREGRMCLLVKGARQVGKTYAIDDFARRHYRHYIRINFDESPSHLAIFDGDLDVTTLIKQISLRLPGAEFVRGQTLLFLDEIQHCPRARTALKFLAQDDRVDVIASGSMLGIHYKDVPSYPVGYVDHLDMHSLDFEEFLWANGVSAASIDDVKSYWTQLQPVPTAIHERMMLLFKEHIVVGGMPRVVQEFMSTHHFGRVWQLQKAIVRDYIDDIAKYAERSDKTKARACFLSIPRHLAKEHKKFQYSLVERGGNARKYGGSLMWLLDAGIINFCHNLSAPELPLEGHAKSDVFKVYMRDTGLLVSMLDEGSAQEIIDGNLGIYKGAIYENIIADILTKSGKSLYYFERDAKMEIDFFIRHAKKATAVEVKSSDNTKSKSVTAVMRQCGVQQAIKLSAKNACSPLPVSSIPLYMAMFL